MVCFYKHKLLQMSNNQIIISSKIKYQAEIFLSNEILKYFRET